jgi:hypothetical protein
VILWTLAAMNRAGADLASKLAGVADAERPAAVVEYFAGLTREAGRL